LIIAWVPLSASAQEAVWSRYQDATNAAERGEHTVAVSLLRAARAEAQEPALKAAICFGLGHSIAALVTPTRPDQPLACEGQAAWRCFLDSPRPEPTARARAEAEEARLAAVCTPPIKVVVVEPSPPPPDRTTPWIWAGAGVAAAAGSVLLVLAANDAAEVRDRQRIGTADLERSAQSKWIGGWGLVGVGAALGGWALWRTVEAAPVVGRQSVGWRWTW
jgi:hypothetical protein